MNIFLRRKFLEERKNRFEIRPMHFKQRFTDCLAAKFFWFCIGAKNIDKRFAGKAVTISMQPIAFESYQHIACFHIFSRDDLIPLNNSNYRTGKVEIAFGIESGHLSSLSA